MKSRFRCARNILLFWCLFIGLGAVAGAVGMLVKPDGSALGMQSLLPYFQVLPFAGTLFQNYIFPGISLLIVNGITNLVAAVLILANKKSGIVCGGFFGITLMLWICIQFVIFPMNFMSTVYFIFGALQASTGYAASVFYRQEHFEFDTNDYTNIGTHPSCLVVYFSRLSYVKKLAYEEAERTGAEIYEITSPEPTSGTGGFWWCGRFGMKGIGMQINDDIPDLEKYDSVTICTPIWVFRVAAPVRTFCEKAADRIKLVNYVVVHHTTFAYHTAADEMDAFLHIKHSRFTSVCCKKGRYRTIESPDYKSQKERVV